MMRCREQGFDTLAASLGLLSLFGVMPENDASRPAVGSVSAIAPWNRLEALKGDRVGQFSIRINVQYRLCFRWTSAGPEDVEIVDYH